MMANERKAMKKQAAKYSANVMIQRILGVACFFLAANSLRDLRSVIYFSLYIIITIVTLIPMYISHAETLSERGKKQSNTKGWDKILLPIYFLLAFYGIYLVAGFGIRFEWNRLNIEWFYVGTVLYIVSCAFSSWAVISNKHFESTARIQNDREQTVITTGAYKIVRHPGYAGIVLWAIATALMFGTIAVGIVSFIIIITIWIRTYFEDRMLKSELKGYLNYSNSVKYRLIPFIW
jgi:protein-S-isoprenylcysteine O-methyltransferase Ste14